jgi:hypothetical protein
MKRKYYKFPIICCFVITLLCGIGTISAKDKTSLVGDGVADDTRAIQAILDSGQEMWKFAKRTKQIKCKVSLEKGRLLKSMAIFSWDSKR